MHEFTLTQNLLDVVLKNADSKRVVQINLLIGPFSGDREESIRFYWRDLAKGSPGEGASLHFEHFALDVKCLNCSGAFYLDEEVSMCRHCFNERMGLLSGEDVRLESIELE
jgi:hydrogenase nickel incorporation protein HypA/HybF